MTREGNYPITVEPTGILGVASSIAASHGEALPSMGGEQGDNPGDVVPQSVETVRDHYVRPFLTDFDDYYNGAIHLHIHYAWRGLDYCLICECTASATGMRKSGSRFDPP